MVTRQTVFRRIIPASVLAAILIFNVVLVLVLVNYKEDRYVRDSEYFVKLDELYNHPENVQELYDMLAGTENTSYQQIYNLAESVLSSDDIRKKTYHKNEKQNLIVKFGGLEWQACYLSLTGNDDDENRTPILTLLLSEAQTLSRYQTWAIAGNTGVTYPCNIYGTSYVRAVTLNNGGQYATNANTLKNVNQNSRNQFAVFTMDDIEGSVTDAIIKPCEAEWQATESAPVVGLFGYNYYNDAWGSPILDYLPEDVSDDYTERTGYDVWKNDYLWLPSHCEIGNIGATGIWKLNNTQRCCGYTYWLRSTYQDTYVTYCAMQINKYGMCCMQPVHDGGYYVLPALHLNLSAASMRASSTVATA